MEETIRPHPPAVSHSAWRWATPVISRGVSDGLSTPPGERNKVLRQPASDRQRERCFCLGKGSGSVTDAGAGSLSPTLPSQVVGAVSALPSYSPFSSLSPQPWLQLSFNCYHPPSRLCPASSSSVFPYLPSCSYRLVSIFLP